MEGTEVTTNISEGSFITRGIRGVISYFGGEGEVKKEVEDTDERATKVCKYFLEGKCRFGDDCWSKHPAGLATAEDDAGRGGSKKQKRTGRKNDESSAAVKTSKKPPMKTAMDVIQRIQWDQDLPAEYFYVGYVDRFSGVQEEPFSRFSNWGDLASAEYEALAVPQHRVQYFKYKDTKVWDKPARLDRVFGSSGIRPGESEDIVAFMDSVDERIRKELAEGRHKEVEAGEDDVSDFSDDDSDDDGINVRLDAGEINDAAADTIGKKHNVPEEERSTHFVAIRITSDEIRSRVGELQHHICEQEEELSECCMPAGLLHVTLGMLRLQGEDGVREAAEMLEELRPALERAAADGVSMRIRGLETFGQRVLYGVVVPEPEEAPFWELVSEVRFATSRASAAVSVTNKFEFTPHLTVCKVNRAVTRRRRSKYLPSALYEDWSGSDFGSQPVDNLQLCVIEQTTRHDGFYTTLNEIQV